jgi:hypothetical protein
MKVQLPPRSGALRTLLLSLVSLLCLTSVGPVSAQDPDGYAVPTGVTVNLPAMTLEPEEFPVEGLNLEYGRLNGIDMYAMALANKLEAPIDEIREQLEEIGWLGRYNSPLSIDLESDPSLPAVVAASHVTEYEDEAGAAEGFELPEVDLGVAEEIDAPELGDESRLSRITLDAGPDGRNYTSMHYTFRTGNLIGEVVIFVFEDSGIEPSTPEEMAESAKTLLDRMNAVLEDDSPDLFRMVLRPAPDPALLWNDQYEFLQVVDGEFIGRFNITPGEVEEYQEFTEVNGVVTEYVYEAYFQELDSDDEVLVDGGYYATVSLLENEGDAANYGQASVDDWVANPDDYLSVEPLEDELEGYDGIVGNTFEFESELGNVVSGYSLYASVGNIAVSVALYDMDGVELDAALMLLEFQVDCVTAGPESTCEPQPIADHVR